jgi:hypothetical protein
MLHKQSVGTATMITALVTTSSVQLHIGVFLIIHGM